MDTSWNLNVGIDYLPKEWFGKRNIKLGLLRLDQIHPAISGNKWFKLEKNIQSALGQGKKSLLTFGGAYSNHLIATAVAAQRFGLKSIGFVRGFHGQRGSHTLAACQQRGMELHFMGREDYRRKAEPQFLEQLQMQHPDAFIIPEGGNNGLGRQGTEGIADYLPQCDIVAVAVGTGATLAGLRNVLPSTTQILGFPALKNASYLIPQLRECWTGKQDAHWELVDGYHFGGFAKRTPQLIEFLNRFYFDFKIPLDFVYTGKMMFGLLDMVVTGRIPDDTHIVAIHTGGLQGNETIADSLAYPDYNSDSSAKLR